ncbi:MAG: alpha/beta hydrolase [Gammaproteobacteria bacterium]|nr:alpha/beta hydrolase [Gammaproteobacteria bacterium]
MSDTRRDRLAAAGADLEYAWHGARERGPSLVLLHEGLGCLALWKDFPARLAAATGCPVLAYSRAGYGGSSPVALPRPLDFHTREALESLPAVLDAAAIADCILVGHSDGASIALVHAGQVRDPRVRGVAVMAPHVLTEDKTLATIAQARDAYAAGGLRERLRRYHGDNVECAFRGWCDAWLAPGFRSWSIEAAVAAIEVPLLVIRGCDDPYNTAVHVERIAALARGPVTVEMLAGCGHAPHVEQADAVLDKLADFLREVGADGDSANGDSLLSHRAAPGQTAGQK